MAFNTNTNTAANAQSNDSWKAQGFINLYLPAAEGKKRKLGAIPLKAARSSEKALMEWLESDPANVTKLAERLIVEYQNANATEGHGFLLD